MFYNFFGWFVFYFQKLTYATMLGHMQKVTHFWAQIKKPKMSVTMFLPRALQFLTCKASQTCQFREQYFFHCSKRVTNSWNTLIENNQILRCGLHVGTIIKSSLLCIILQTQQVKKPTSIISATSSLSSFQIH